MSQFKFSSKVDINKLFLVNRSELKGRLDTIFYKPLYVKNEEFIKKSKWGYEKISNLTQRIVDGPFGSDLKANEYQPSGIPLLRVSNIKTGEVEGNIAFISDVKQQQLKRSMVFPGDVLLTKAGAILGYSAVFPEHLKEGNITSHLVTITCKKTINPHYLSHYFRCNIGQLQIYRWGNKSTRPELNTSEVKNILVTVPPLDIQSKIVDTMEAGYKSRQQKEQQAQALLAGIDAYLLAELGITLPKQDNSLDKRIFKVQFKAVAGQRLDPLYFNTLGGGLFSSKYSYYKLSEIGHYFKSGFGAGKQDQVKEEIGIIQIRPTNINAQGELVFHKNVYVQMDENSFLRYGDVLFNNTNSQELVGKTSLVDIENKKLTYSNHITVIRANQGELNPIYLQSILNLYQKQKYFYSICTNWNNQSGVGVELLKNVKIPVPPINKQDDIVAHIQRIRFQAKQLKTEAAQILADAKAEAERLILGE